MGFFKRNWDKPGPGVPKNAPKKTGFPRFIEILSRDLGYLFKLNLILLVALLPAGILYTLAMLAYFSGGALLALLLALAALLACIPLGGVLTAFFYLIAQRLRDAPGFLWHDFKRKFKESFRFMLLPGLLFGAMLGSLGFAFISLLLGAMQIQFVFGVIYVVASFYLGMTYPYFFTQAAYLELGPAKLLYNSFLLATGNLPRSFMGTLLGSGLVLAQFLFFPYATLLTFLIGFSIPALLNLMWIWPRIDKTFKISDTLQKRHEEQYADVSSNKFE